ncbi:unnamed protein product [Phytophthora fragariaefolia]|uniref:Unnamed protein product n=1 Tax=Phytophthora fragariaefolia TaxID=1490495 RepID=A0A9W6Y652_9STRA|nr:unnamed protein product [Phytophthora fragariaefolia]
MKRAEKPIVVGISDTQKGYKLLLPQTKRFITSSGVQNINKLDINEPKTAEVLQRLHQEEIHSETPSNDDINQPDVGENYSDQRGTDETSDGLGVPEDFGRPIPAGVLRRVFGRRHTARTEQFQLPKSFIDAFAGPAYVLLTICASDHIKEPKTLGEAMRCKYWWKWKKAMDKKLADFQANGTWKLVYTPENVNLMTAKWVAQAISLRLIALLAALWEAKVLQGDVPKAYLKSPLDKPIYLTRPNGATGVSAGQSWLLLKGLYGLKQSGKLWNDMIDAFLKAEDFTRSKVDPCIYFMHLDGNLCDRAPI